MNIVADRSQEGGLSTVGYDDDGVRSIGSGISDHPGRRIR